MNLTFLSAAVPLTKTITLRDGVISKDSYPLLNKFTSNTIETNNITAIYEAICAVSQHEHKPCLLKGNLTHPLEDESRKGTTRSNDTTEYVVFDLDRAPFNNADEFMAAVGLEHISYVVQYSASYKLNKKDKTLSCHIFCLLSAPIKAPELKAWLMYLNMSTPVLRAALTLSNSNFALHWPLDITCCQNDKLIYIAEPVFVGMKSPIPSNERVQLIAKDIERIPVESIAIRAMDALKKEQRKILNDLQVAANIPPTKTKTKMVKDYEVQVGVGEIASYEVIDAGEYNRINLNGGDSNAYYHLKTDLTLLHNFKGEPSCYIKEILPNYYADMTRQQSTQRATPNAAGDVILAYCDKITADYYKGTWNEANQKLEVYRVKNKDQIKDYLLSHQLPVGDFVPEWTTIFDPQNTTVVDEQNHILNRFIPGHYMQPTSQIAGAFPAIQRLVNSAVGTGDIQVHFLNWLAYIFQLRKKPLTAWILHGTYGTGKGMLINKVISPLFGNEYVRQMVAPMLDQDFNDFLEKKLIVFVDEIDAGMFEHAKKVESKLFNWITEPTLDIRKMRTDYMSIPNYVSFIFASNKPEPVRIPAKDRRFNVGQFQTQRYYPTDEELAALPQELAHFAYFLQHYEVDEKAVHTVLENDERKAIQELGVTSIDQIANDLKEGNLRGLLDALPDTRLLNEMGILNPNAAAYTSLVRRFVEETLNEAPRPKNTVVNSITRELAPLVSKITRDELAVIFTHCVGKVPEGAHKFSTYLRHHGIITKRIRVGNEVPHGIAVEWKTDEETIAYAREVFPPKTVTPLLRKEA